MYSGYVSEQASVTDTRINQEEKQVIWLYDSSAPLNVLTNY